MQENKKIDRILRGDIMCVWKVMADTFDFDDSAIKELLYENYPVQKFMKVSHSMGISACEVERNGKWWW